MTTTTADTTGTNLSVCLCGCGRPTKATFAPGHDAKLVGMAARGELPVGHWLAGLDVEATYAAIASRASTALAAKFHAMTVREAARVEAKAAKAAAKARPSQAAKTCPKCGATGEQVCRQANGRAMPKGRRHQERETVFAA